MVIVLTTTMADAGSILIETFAPGLLLDLLGDFLEYDDVPEILCCCTTLHTSIYNSKIFGWYHPQAASARISALRRLMWGIATQPIGAGRSRHGPY